jgi:sec-independent protein translocase protein TatA
VPNIGPLEIVVILVLVALIFGAKRIPELARSTGKGIRELRSSVRVDDEGDEGSQVPPPVAKTESRPPSDQGSSK